MSDLTLIDRMVVAVSVARSIRAGFAIPPTTYDELDAVAALEAVRAELSEPAFEEYLAEHGLQFGDAVTVRDYLGGSGE